MGLTRSMSGIVGPFTALVAATQPALASRRKARRRASEPLLTLSGPEGPRQIITFGARLAPTQRGRNVVVFPLEGTKILQALQTSYESERSDEARAPPTCGRQVEGEMR